MNDTTLSPSDVIDTLNSLIELSRDGQKGFQEAAEKIDAPDTRTFCLEQSRQRAHFVGELQTLVHVLGDEPDNTGTITGALRRGWMDLKSALGGGDHAILVVVESSEDQAVREYQKALTKTLPADVREIVQRQSYSVKQAHDTIHVMRDRLAI
ncbi:MAG: PA2169 family four-helix-bundle protein [Pseudomonadota bacterium]